MARPATTVPARLSRAVLPDADVPTSISSSGVPVVNGPASTLGSIAGEPARRGGPPASSATYLPGDGPRPMAEPGADGHRLRGWLTAALAAFGR